VNRKKYFLIQSTGHILHDFEKKWKSAEIGQSPNLTGARGEN
jgi:hypothetical protein